MIDSDKKSTVCILAGGFGSRLTSEIGEKIPKPMAPINGLPLLEHQIDLCCRYGFVDILILVHHLSEVITQYFSDGSHLGVNIKYQVEESPRGTAGAVFDALPALADEFLIIYGDTFLEVDLRRFCSSKDMNSAVLTFVHPNSHPYDSDLLELDEKGLVTKVFRPTVDGSTLYKNTVNAALYFVKNKIFSKYVPTYGSIDISSELFPLLIKSHEAIQAYISVEYIKDMGTPERYREVNLAVTSGVVDSLSNKSPRKCVFLDRDGVINVEVDHLSNISQFELIPGVVDAIRALNKAGYLAVCVTNQPVIARGDLSFAELDDIHMKMEVELGAGGAYLDGIYFCPHHPHQGFPGEIEDLKIVCSCRKPEPGMLIQASERYYIDLEASWMVGDHMRDIIAGKTAGVKTILIRNLEQISSDRQADHICKSLSQAVDLILTENSLYKAATR
jgi:D,D-heptose 1,7-bisphosphate phosphatase